MHPCLIYHAKRNGNALLRDGQSRAIGDKAVYGYNREMKLYNEMKHTRHTEDNISNDETKEIPEDNSMHSVIPATHNFRLLGVTPLFDMNNIYDVDPMNQLHLGISNMLKNCVLERMRTVHNKANTLNTSGSGNSTNSSVRKGAIEHMNTFVENVTVTAY